MRPERPEPPASLLWLIEVMAAKDPLSAEPRRKLYEAITSYPGLHLAELARQADVDEKLARYHARVLVKAGLATKRREGNKNLYFPMKESELGSKEVIDRRDKEALSLLRRPVPLRMVLALLDAEDGLTMGQLAEASGVSRSTATYHVQNLEDAEVIRIEQQGRSRVAHLADPKRTTHLLSDYPPPKDVVSGFVDMWDNLEL